MINKLGMNTFVVGMLIMAGCTATPAIAQSPQPFLTLPLARNTSPLEVSQGWLYSEDEKAIHPDIPTHFAVDFPAKWGTPVYAPADGVAVASYHTYDMTDAKGRTIGYGLGLFVQIWHEGGSALFAVCSSERCE